MATPDVLDLEALLGPISEDSATGDNLRADVSPTSPYHGIKDARQTARAAERSAVLEDDPDALSHVDWRPILEQAKRILGQNSKDLEITAWLIEALARVHGFAGLRDGFRLAAGLVERYWDELHPLPDEDGLLTRVAPLIGLNGEDAEGTLIVPIARIPITGDDPTGPYATWHHAQARELARIEDEAARKQKIAAGAVSPEDFDAAVRATPPGVFVNLVEDVEQALEAFAALSLSLDERCGAEAPPTSNIRQALTSALDTVRFVARDVIPAPSSEVESSSEAPLAGAASAGNPSASGVSGAIGSREDAFRTLQAVAEYFRRTEPHSPLSYVLEQAVRWGQMPLPQLLDELIPDQSARTHFLQLTGIRVRGE